MSNKVLSNLMNPYPNKIMSMKYKLKREENYEVTNYWFFL